MSRLALSLQKCARVHVSRGLAVALSLVAILLTAAPQLAAAGPPASGKVAGALSISSVSQNEGTGGTTIFTFNVTHTGTSDAFSVTVATDRTFSGSDEATANDDYTGKTETFNFDGTDGETKAFNVAVQGDSEVEGDEFFQAETVSFSAVGAPLLGLPTNCPCVGLGEIKNDDVATSGTSVSIGNASGPEGDSGTKNFNFTVTRSGDPGAFTVDVATAVSTLTDPDPATPGEDYVTKTQTLSFGANENTKTFSVVVNGDTKFEDSEQFLVKLSNAQGSGVSIDDGQGLGTITNDDEEDGGGGGGGDDGGGGEDGGGGGDTESLEIFPPTRGFDARQWKNAEIKVKGTGEWKPGSDVGWVTVYARGGERDEGSLFYDVNANPGSSPRVGRIYIGSHAHVVTQAAGTSASSSTLAESYVKSVHDALGLFSVGLSAVQLTSACQGDFSRTSGARELCTIDAVPAATLLVPYFAVDLNGDGLEEVGTKGFAPNGATRGAKRGAWVQFYNDKGKRLLNFFPGAKFPGLQLLPMDADGNGKVEAVVLGIQESGASELQLRTSKGGLQDRKSVSPAGSEETHLIPIQFDGRRGTEIGVAYEDKKGAGQFVIWGLPKGGKKLQKLAEHSVIGQKSDLHRWLTSDVNGDGRGEIVATYAGPSGKGATLRVVEAASGKVLVNKQVLSTAFDQSVWSAGDFDPDLPGSELLVGHRRKSNGGAFFKVLAGTGKELSKGGVAGKTTVHTWQAMRSAPGPRGTVRSLVFVGFTKSNGDRAFEVWDPSKKKAKRVGGGTVADDAFQVLSWQIQDFDGDADNGPEIVAVTRHVGDGSIGFQMFGRDGKARGNRVDAFDGNYISVRASPIVFARKNRVDLQLMARTVGGQPEIHIWNVAGELLLKKLDVLGSGVQ